MEATSSGLRAERIVFISIASLTCLSWYLAVSGSPTDVNLVRNVILVMLAFIKVRFIIFYFMEVRHASFLLKLSCEAWIWITATGILAAVLHLY